VWDAEKLEQIGEPLIGHSNGVFSVAFSPDGKQIVSSSDDKTIQVWDAEKLEQFGEPLISHSGLVMSVALFSHLICTNNLTLFQ
jgi:WD40 repeat protein